MAPLSYTREKKLRLWLKREEERCAQERRGKVCSREKRKGVLKREEERCARGGRTISLVAHERRGKMHEGDIRELEMGDQRHKWFITPSQVLL
jgi:hypothetical protein